MRVDMRNKKVKVIVFSTIFLFVLSLGGIFKVVETKKAQAIEREKQIALEEERIKAEEEAKKKAEEEARIKAEEEAKRKAEEEKKNEQKPKDNQTQQDTSSEFILESNLPIKERIQKYLGSDINRFGFIYYDLTSGEKIAINENKVFTAASTYKVGLNMVTYEKIRNGSLDINKGITYVASNDYEGGTGILQGQVNTTLAKPVPVSKLLELAITHSDNIATRMLNRILGGAKGVRQNMNSMVGSSNKTTPEIQFRLLKKLYENRDDKYYSQLISNMKNTIFHDRLDKYLPYDKVAHKIGNYGGAVSDIGIVFTDKPYVIVAYAEGVSGPAEKISKISRMIYNEQLKK